MYASGRNRLLVVSRFISIQIRTKMANANDVVEIESDPESKCTSISVTFIPFYNFSTFSLCHGMLCMLHVGHVGLLKSRVNTCKCNPILPNV